MDRRVFIIAAAGDNTMELWFKTEREAERWRTGSAAVRARCDVEVREPRPALGRVQLDDDRARWPKELLELFEERAAIMEFDGGLERDEAEQEAERIIRQRHGLASQARLL